MNVTTIQTGPPPPPDTAPLVTYRDQELVISLSADERKQLFRAAACTTSAKCSGFADFRPEPGATMYDLMVGIYHCLRHQGETTGD